MILIIFILLRYFFEKKNFALRPTPMMYNLDLMPEVHVGYDIDYFYSTSFDTRNGCNHYYYIDKRIIILFMIFVNA